MRLQLPRPAVLAAACFASFLLALPVAAGAATSKYPSASAAGFNGGLAGWTSSSSNEGICLPPLLCASVDNSFQGTGGADGGGYIRSAYTGVVGVTAVGGTTVGTWESSPFTYGGVGGEQATAVGFSLDRRANVDQLLAVAGSSAEYTVRLIDLSDGGGALTLIPAATLAGAGSWTEVARGSVDPSSLTVGHDYRIQITSRYTSGTSVLATGSADYDNVVLRASDGSSGNGGNGNGANGKDGSSKGSGALSERRLIALLRQAAPGTAALGANGKRLFVRVGCPGKIGHACRTTVQGLLRKRRPATGKRTVRLRSGRSWLVALRVKPKARQQLAKRKRLLVRQKVRAGKAIATVVKSRRLIRR